MYTGKTQNLGIIGCPVEHSLSPAMQNAALSAAGLDYAYVAMSVAEEQLSEAVTGLKALKFRGFNVTIPHKAAIMPLLDVVDQNAAVMGAVNTVVVQDGSLHGYNTDVLGFMNALRDRGFDPQGKTAVLLGAGGAARAVLWGLLQGGVKLIRIGVRNVPKVEPLADFFRKYGKVELFHWEEDSFQHGLAEADLLVNTTPLGMYPHIDAVPPVNWAYVQPKTFVYDIIYTPIQTKFLQMAEQHGNPVLNGEGMLVGQGAEAFRLWTGQTADSLVMTQALRQALQLSVGQ